MKYLIMAAGIAVTGAAHAAETIRPYIGLQYHWTNSDIHSGDVIPGSDLSIDDKDSGLGIRGGVLQEYHAFDELMGFVGAELSFVDLGEITATGPGFTASTEADGIDLSLIGATEVAWRNTFAYGRIGLFQWDATSQSSGAGTSFNDSDSGTDFVVGFGMMYFFDEIQIRGGFDRYRMEYDSDSVVNVDAWNIGAQLTF
ncbi:porin family protein [Alcanivorax sp. S6407]|uniref:outer membrane beta-barrel protein n=1 Tax=Alcanivorax sp. S6407 TaxID=2926424 RepID=UPI001FF33E79|nr:outer membrane beta-barrel protein [Alcanivorax sp. S6407]MCK0154508.1 porin family protein [Alcanivorax sp. S6407]